MSDMYRWLDIVKQGMEMAAKAGEREAQQSRSEFDDNTEAKASVYAGQIKQHQNIDVSAEDHLLRDKPELQAGQKVVIDQLYGPGAGHGVFVAYSLDGRSAICNIDSVDQSIPVEFISRDSADVSREEFSSTGSDGCMSPLSAREQNTSDLTVNNKDVHMEDLEKWMKTIEEANEVDEGYSVRLPIDKERYTDLSGEGLEGPFSTKSGKVVYYDPKAGKYYDRDTDMYLSDEDYRALDEAAPVADLDAIWRKVEQVVAEIAPDGDPVDYLAPWLEKQGLPYEIADKAARKNGYADVYAYYDEVYDEYQSAMHESSPKACACGEYDCEVCFPSEPDKNNYPERGWDEFDNESPGAYRGNRDLYDSVEEVSDDDEDPREVDYDDDDYDLSGNYLAKTTNVKESKNLKESKMKLKEFGPLVGMAVRAGSAAAGSAIGSKIADKVMGEQEHDEWEEEPVNGFGAADELDDIESNDELGNVSAHDAPEDVSDLIGEIDYLQNLGMSMANREYNVDKLIDMPADMIKRIHSKVKGTIVKEWHEEEDDVPGYYDDEESEEDGDDGDDGRHDDYDPSADRLDPERHMREANDDIEFEPEDDEYAGLDREAADMTGDAARSAGVDLSSDKPAPISDYYDDSNATEWGDDNETPSDAGDEIDGMDEPEVEVPAARVSGASMDVSDMLGKIAYMQDMGMSLSDRHYDTEKLMMMNPDVIQRVYSKVVGESKKVSSDMFISSLHESKKTEKSKKVITEGADADVVKALKALFD
jgi:hypothetical protein